MKKNLVFFALMNLAALIWLGGLAQAGPDSAPNPGAALAPPPSEDQDRPEETARPRGQRNKAEARKTTIVLAPKTEKVRESGAQADKRAAGRKKTSKMPPTQSYPPARPPVETGLEQKAAPAEKRGRNKSAKVTDTDKNSKVTTIELPRKREPGSRGLRSGKKAEPADSAPAASFARPEAGGPANPAALENAGRGGGKTGSRAERKKSVAKVPAASALSLLPGPAANLTPEQEMARAYQAFDLAYNGSLGKTKRELDQLWGFSLLKLGDNGDEVAYGFRQKGLLNMPEPPAAGRGAGKKSNAPSPSYYAASTWDPALPGRYFSCLVVLWVDKKGRGVVVDGDALGDCFLTEALSRQPDKFER